MTLDLDGWLGRMYRAHVLTLESVDKATKEFRAALASDPVMQAQARIRLKSFDGIDEKRCFITQKQREFLTAALAVLT